MALGRKKRMFILTEMTSSGQIRIGTTRQLRLKLPLRAQSQ